MLVIHYQVFQNILSCYKVIFVNLYSCGASKVRFYTEYELWRLIITLLSGIGYWMTV